MRTFWWACIGVAVLTCAVAYPIFNQPLLPAPSVAPSEQPDLHPFEQNPELPLTGQDEARLEPEQVETIDVAPVASEPNQSPDTQKEARLEDTTATVSIQPPERNDTNQDLSYLAYYAYSELPPRLNRRRSSSTLSRTFREAHRSRKSGGSRAPWGSTSPS